MIWQGSHTHVEQDFQPTGFALLDEKLQGGFPKHGVIELQSPSGIGELRLLTPHLRRSLAKGLVVFIHPPGYVCPDHLYAEGIDPDQVLLVYPKSAQEALWTAEQCLKSGACSSVMLWHGELEIHQARRLQVASETGDCLQFIFKQTHASQDDNNVISLPVSLSLKLTAHPVGLNITITKRKGDGLTARLS